MANAEDIKKMIVVSRTTWGMVDKEGKTIPYDTTEPYKDPVHDETYRFDKFYPRDYKIKAWVRDLKKYQVEIKSGTLKIDGETVESLQADIERFEKQIQDEINYEKWKDKNYFEMFHKKYKNEEDDDED